MKEYLVQLRDDNHINFRADHFTRADGWFQFITFTDDFEEVVFTTREEDTHWIMVIPDHVDLENFMRSLK